jgi:hypothetical protein
MLSGLPADAARWRRFELVFLVRRMKGELASTPFPYGLRTGSVSMARFSVSRPVEGARMSAVGGDRIAMRVSTDWDYAVAAGVCPDGEKTGGRVCRFAETAVETDSRQLTPKHHGKPAIIQDQRTRPVNKIDDLAKSAKPPSPVQIRAAPLNFLKEICASGLCLSSRAVC